jgi:MurNAc alpha-1-phosphate uridylyltransferase
MTFPDTAMVLAAGFGKRLRPLTEETPKPLVKVAGRPLIDWVLDRLAEGGVKRAVVNTHWLGERIVEHLADRSIKKALPLLGKGPFFSVNAKILWLDGKTNALHRLAEAWDDARMDALLLLQPTATAVGYDGVGDFVLDPLGTIRRRKEREVAPFLFSGIQLLHPRLFEGSPDGFFSLNLLYDRAIEAGRLHGLRHDGEWYHVSTPRQLTEVEERLAEVGFWRR